MANTKFTEEQITEGLMCVIAWAGNVAQAHRQLKERGLNISYATLGKWVADDYREKYEQMREKYADQKEQQMAHEFRDVAARAVHLQSLALDKAERRLMAGDDHDPAKTAMMMSRVGHTAVDKLMTLTNRPARITEQRDIGEVIRSLAGMGVLKPLPAASQVAQPGEAADATAEEMG